MSKRRQGAKKGRGAGRYKSPSTTLGSVTIISPPPLNFVPPNTYQVDVVVRSVDGAVLTAPVTWASSNQAVFTVSSTGLMTAVAAGTATLRAGAGSVFATLTITVTSPSLTPDHVVVTPATGQMIEGQSTLVFAVVEDAANNALPGQTVVWSTSNAAVATVGSDSGDPNHQATVTAQAVGTATITATSGALTDTFVVTVVAAGAYTPVVKFYADDYASDAALKAASLVGFEGGAASWAPPVSIGNWYQLQNADGGLTGKMMRWLAGPALNSAHNIFTAKSIAPIKITVTDATSGSGKRKIVVQDHPSAPTVVETFDEITQANIGAAINTGVVGINGGNPSSLVSIAIPTSQALSSKWTYTFPGSVANETFEAVDAQRGRQHFFGLGHAPLRNVWTRLIERFSPDWEIQSAVGGEAAGGVKHLFNRLYNNSGRWANLFQGVRGMSYETSTANGGLTVVATGGLPWGNAAGMNSVYSTSGWPYPDAWPMFHADSGPAGAPVGDGDGEWYEIIMHAKLGVDGIAPERNEYTLMWRRLTLSGSYSPGAWKVSASFLTLQTGQQAIPLAKLEVGVYRNRQYDHDMEWDIKLAEIVNGSVYPDPWGVGISV